MLLNEDTNTLSREYIIGEFRWKLLDECVVTLGRGAAEIAEARQTHGKAIGNI